MTVGGVRFQMFEPNMDEYLDEEVEWVRHTLDVINREWQRKACVTAS
jgi:recyclin-1